MAWSEGDYEEMLQLLSYALQHGSSGTENLDVREVSLVKQLEEPTVKVELSFGSRTISFRYALSEFVDDPFARHPSWIAATIDDVLRSRLATQALPCDDASSIEL
jgi:hypothetical protein